MKWSTILLLITLLFIVKSDLNKEQLSKYSIYEFIKFLKETGLWNIIYNFKLCIGDYVAISSCEILTGNIAHCSRVVTEFMDENKGCPYLGSSNPLNGIKNENLSILLKYFSEKELEKIFNKINEKIKTGNKKSLVYDIFKKKK